MIALKLWNKLDDSTRSIIAQKTGHPSLTSEYHHNFDYDATGKRLKQTLEQCYLQKDNSINVVVNLVQDTTPPKFLIPPVVPKQLSKRQQRQAEYTELEQEGRYAITYDDGDDISHVWVTARSRSEAMDVARREYHDIKRIIDCYKM